MGGVGFDYIVNAPLLPSHGFFLVSLDVENLFVFLVDSSLPFFCGGSGGGMRFPDSSVDKESACNAGDLSLIPGLGRSPGEGIGYPLQYSWASLVAQLVKNLPAMQETSV